MSKIYYIGGGEHKRDLIPVLVLVFVTFVCLFLSSCKTTQHTGTHTDSVRVEIRHDSVYIWQHDSIFRDRWRNGDTVFVQVEKYKTLYKDKLVEIHDTIATSRTDTIMVQVEKKSTAFWKGSGIAFWVLIGVLVIGCAVGLVIKFAK